MPSAFAVLRFMTSSNLVGCSTGMSLGLDVAKLEIRRAEDIAPAFEAIKGRADALYVGPDPLVNANRVRIHTLSLSAQLPTIYGFRGYVEVGGLMSYGPNTTEQFWRAAEIVDKVLHGAKPIACGPPPQFCSFPPHRQDC